jgi:hypothetical protein
MSFFGGGDRVATTPITPSSSRGTKRQHDNGSTPRAKRRLEVWGTGSESVVGNLRDYAAEAIQGWWRTTTRRLQGHVRNTFGNNANMKGRGRYARRRQFARIRRNPPGFGYSGSQLVKCKVSGTFALTAQNSDWDYLRVAPTFTATTPGTTTAGIKANSPHRPMNFIANAQATANPSIDSFGFNLPQMLWKRYRCVKAVLTCTSIRTVGEGRPLMCGINLCDPGAKESAPATPASNSEYKKRGRDLDLLNLRRDAYLNAKGLTGAGKTNIMKDSNTFRHKMSATWTASKWNRGHHYDPESQWRNTINQTTPTVGGNAPGDEGTLDGVTPEEPANIVYFQPWCCDPLLSGTATGTDNAIGFQFTLTQYFLCKEKRMRDGYQT